MKQFRLSNTLLIEERSLFSPQTLKRTVENIKDPLYRYFEREVNSGAKLLQDVIHDLNDVALICQVTVQLPHFPWMYHQTNIKFRARRSRQTTTGRC